MGSSTSDLFWFWWALTIGLVVWQFCRAWLCPKEALALPTVLGAMWLYFYGVLPYQLVTHGTALVGSRILAIAQAQAFLAFASLLVGWYSYLASWRNESRPKTPSVTLEFGRLWWCGVGLQVVGLTAYYSFAASGRSFESTSAYWYTAFNLCYPGMSICAAVLVLSSQRRNPVNFLIFVGLALLVIWPFLLGARRGPTFVAIIAIIFSCLICRRHAPRPSQVFGTLLGAGVLLMCLVTSRNVLYQEGGTWEETFERLTIKDVVQDRTTKTGDNEFSNGCLLLEANLRTGLYQYGTTHLAMLLHWLPRSWWPGKPMRNQGFFPSALGETAASAEESNLGYGGAWGAVADTFDNYWWFFPIFWFLVGAGVAAMFARAVLEDSVRWKLHYVGVLCATHWFVAQCLPEALVPALFYQAAYFVAFRFATVPAQSPRPRRIRRPAFEPRPAP